MERKILFGSDARKKVQEGVNIVADATCVTLGPMGRNVLISKAYPSQHGMQYLPIHCTKDGVSVARSIQITDHVQNIGASLVKEAAEKTMQLVGDSTTSCILLTQAILTEGMKLVEKGFNVQELKKGIDAAVEMVVEKLKGMAIPVGDDIEKIRQIATVSANNDSSIGDLIAEAFQQIGKDGIISLEESKSTKTEIKIIEGMQFDRGWVSPYFITDLSKQTCEMANVFILLYDKKLYQLAPIENLLSQAVKEDKSVLIICDDADGEALAAIAMNAARKTLKACIVKSPGFLDQKREDMEDIALLTGGQYISDEKGLSLASTTFKHLGRAEKVTISKDSTTIVGSKGDKGALETLLNDLKMNLTRADESEKEKIEKRIAKLTGGVAALYVGAPTETEMKEKKDRCDDAIRAVKAAMQEGIVPGGGTAFILASDVLNGIREKNFGAQLIYDVMFAPLLKICENAGVDGNNIANDIWTGREKGYNAKTGEYQDLVEAGIIDPVKANRCSLQHAASAATMILTSEALICDVM